MIDFYLDSDSIEAGSELNGSCIWTPHTRKNEKPLNLEIGWRTEGKGISDEETLFKTEIRASERTYFKSQIPIAGPVSYDGHLIRIIWEIRVSSSKFFVLKDVVKTQVLRIIPRQ